MSELGLRLARPVETKSCTLVPEASAAWLHDFAIDDHVVNATFVDAPGAPFSIRGQKVELDGLAAGAGVKILGRNGLSCGIRYNAEFREGFQSHGLSGQFRFEFGKK